MMVLAYSATLGILLLVLLRQGKHRVPTAVYVVTAVVVAGIGYALTLWAVPSHIAGLWMPIWGASLIGGAAFRLFFADSKPDHHPKHAWWTVAALTPALAVSAIPSTLTLVLPLVALLWSNALRDAIGSGLSSPPLPPS